MCWLRVPLEEHIARWFTQCKNRDARQPDRSAEGGNFTVISLDLALIFLLLLVVLNCRARRSVLYPPFIFCAMWLLVLVLAGLCLIEVNHLHSNTLGIVAAGTAFSIGSLLSGLTPRALLRIHVFLPLSRKG
jgi:hypothetical protein